MPIDYAPIAQLAGVLLAVVAAALALRVRSARRAGTRAEGPAAGTAARSHAEVGAGILFWIAVAITLTGAFAVLLAR